MIDLIEEKMSVDEQVEPSSDLKQYVEDTIREYLKPVTEKLDRTNTLILQKIPLIDFLEAKMKEAIPRPYLPSASSEHDLRNLEERILASPMSSSVVLASGPVVVKGAIEDSGFLEEARRPGSTLPKDLLQICTDRGIEPGPDQFVACVAFYVFGAVKFGESLSYLLSYTARHERELPTGWASHFAIHALKILTEQEDRDDRYFFYDTAHRQDAINKALKYVYR